MNKRFYQLDNLEWLYLELQKKSMQTLAFEIGCSRGSIAWIVKTRFSDAQKANLCYDRLGKIARDLVQ